MNAWFSSTESDAISTLENSLNINYENSMKLRIMLHTAYALERALLKDGLVISKTLISKDTYNDLPKIIKQNK